MDLVTGLMDFSRFLHSWTRWLVLIAAAAAVVLLIVNLAQKKGYGKPVSSIMAAFSGLVGLQWIIGLVLLVTLGSMTGFGIRHYWEHLFSTTLALVTAHGHYMLRRRTMADTRRQVIYLVLVVVTLLLIVVGIWALPDGIQWRFYTPA